VLAGRKHGASIVAQLKGNDGRDQAALFSQCKIALLRSQLPALAPNEFYWVDLEGLAVHTLEGKPLGFVASLYNSAGVDVMIVTQENKEQHIPFLMDDTVVKVDMQEKVILVDWDIPND
jgi:16S rRNA processing protein RimM